MMIQPNPLILMKKTKPKSYKKIKKVTSVKTNNIVKEKILTTPKNVVTQVKKPKIAIDVLATSKKTRRSLKSISNIEVPRTIKQELIKKESTEEESQFDVNGERKKRRGRNKKEKIYFSKKTEDAIIEYNSEDDDHKRNEIYETKIKFSFDKLVENIFNTFKFTYFDNSPLEIQKETVSHLVTNIHKFQAGKGKAFSYFSIVAKNYLIFHNNNNYKRFNQHVDISETPSESSVCLQTEDAHHKDIQTQEFMKLIVNYWELNLSKIFNKQKDLNIAYAVIELFRNCERIENFNKKTLYLYIRELSNCKTQQITKVINKMKSYQTIVMKNYSHKGTL
jgi:hypothetical protein